MNKTDFKLLMFHGTEKYPTVFTGYSRVFPIHLFNGFGVMKMHGLELNMKIGDLLLVT